MKKALPANTKISKDAKETVHECVSEFISFITGEVSDKCQREKRKTINDYDFLWAMMTLGFEEYVELLKVYLAKYSEMEGEKKTIARPDEKDGGVEMPPPQEVDESIRIRIIKYVKHSMQLVNTQNPDWFKVQVQK